MVLLYNIYVMGFTVNKENHSTSSEMGRSTYRPLYSNDFCEVFDDLLKRTVISCYQINKYTGLDETYLSRLRNGQKNNPSAETILKISLALTHLSEDIALHDIEGLFNSVGRSIHLK